MGAQSYVITAESLNNDATFKQTVYGASGTIDGLIAGNQYIITVCAQGIDSSNKAFWAKYQIMYRAKLRELKSAA